MVCEYLDNFFKGIPFNEKLFDEEKKVDIIIKPDVAHPASIKATKSCKNIEAGIIDDFIALLVKKDINLVCFDFDNTIANPEYTEEYIESPKNIAKRLSPLFIKLANKLNENFIYVAIVTFNMNRNIEPGVNCVLDIPAPVFAREDSRLATGKMWHLDSAIQYFNKRTNLNDDLGIKPINVLLIDDDPMNISNAKRQNYHTINNEQVITLDNLIRFVDTMPCSPPSSPRSS